MTESPYSIIVIEDDNEVLKRLLDILEQSGKFNILYSGDTINGGINALKKYHPDVLLTDLSLLDEECGIDIIKAIRQFQLDTQAMVITGFQDEHLVFSALEAGAQGYILKHDHSQNIVDSVLTMVAGGAPISPVIARLMLQKFQRNFATPTTPETLTKKQITILRYVSQGFSSQEIAEKLTLSYYTVTTHIKNIYSKLQVNSRTEALYEAAKLGLIQQ